MQFSNNKLKIGILTLAVVLGFLIASYLSDTFAPFKEILNFNSDGDQEEYIEEREVVIGEGGEFPLPGTLTMPKGEGPFPAVLLVHGTGPNDRDGTARAYKPFRDIAEGLSKKGIAVLRYEKRTMAYPALGSNPELTVQEETIEDVLLAIELLQREKEIDQENIYIVGHSLGGMLVPRIIENDGEGKIAGAIIMSAPSRPLEDIAIWQNQQMLERAKLAGEATEGIEAQVELVRQQMELLKDPQYSAEAPPEEFILGNWLWWHDIRGYYGGEIAKFQRVPLLILQGENDVQISMSELEGWRKALSSRKDVDYKAYPKLNHFYMEVDKPSTGEEYFLPSNIPQYVLQDIADWIMEQQ